MDSINTNSTPRWAAERIIKKRCRRLPTELVNNILSYIYPHPEPATVYRAFPKPEMAGRSPVFTPPADGTSPFMKLPVELRRDIFAESLPSKDVLIHPKCDEDKKEEAKDAGGKRWVKRNRASDLMTLNKEISGEIAEVLYQERTFVVHVHEGLKNGGIEFLHTGRQPLQYQDNIADGRFWKFSDGEIDFGFGRLKRIHVQIFPSDEKKCKHSAINTYFMNLALVRLLDTRGEKKNDITSLTIEFMPSKKDMDDQQGRLATQRAEQYWWDPDKKQPRESSVHGLPNIELVLRPFANLTACHKVSIEMPHNVAFHPRIAKFVQDLKASMTSLSRFPTMFADDDLEMKIESARWVMEDYVNYTLHGTKYQKVDDLRDDEVHEPGPDGMDLDSDGEGDVVARKRKTKRGLSPASQSTSPGSESKKSRTDGEVVEWQAFAANSRDQSSEPSPNHYSIEDDEALARAIYESEQDGRSGNDAEDKQLQAAIAASMKDAKAPKIAEQKTSLASSNRFAVLSTADDVIEIGGPAFVDQGRSLRNSTNGASLSTDGQGNPNPRMAVDAAPWSVDPGLKNFYKMRTTINGSAKPSPGMERASIPDQASPSTPTAPRFASTTGEDRPSMFTGSPPTKEASQLNISGSGREEKTDNEDQRGTKPSSSLEALRARRLLRLANGNGLKS